MTEQKTREYLRQIKVLCEKRDKREEQIAELRAVATNCVAPTDKETVMSSGSADKMSNIVGRMVDLEREIDDLNEIIENRRFVVAKMSELLQDNRQTQWIKLRFLEFNGFYDTVMIMELADSTARRIERKAILGLSRLINE